MALDSLCGQRFGRLIVLDFAGANKWRKTLWQAKCDCGKEIVVSRDNLVRERTRSCGCLAKEGNNKRHGYAKDGEISPTYHSWGAMKRRCLNENDSAFDRYGGRGISICESWKNSFQAFLADMGEKPAGKSLDRKDNALGYFPENCRWATPKEQANNRMKRRKRNGRER